MRENGKRKAELPETLKKSHAESAKGAEFPQANNAGAGEVASYATTRERRGVMSGERREVRDKCFSLLFGFKYDEEASAGMVGAFLLRTPPPTLPCMGGRVRGRERMQEEGRGGPTPALPAGREEEEGGGVG